MTNIDRFDLIHKTSSGMAKSLARLEESARKEGVAIDLKIYYQLLGYIQGLCICDEEEE